MYSTAHIIILIMTITVAVLAALGARLSEWPRAHGHGPAARPHTPPLCIMMAAKKDDDDVDDNNNNNRDDNVDAVDDTQQQQQQQQHQVTISGRTNWRRRRRRRRRYEFRLLYGPSLMLDRITDAADAVSSSWLRRWRRRRRHLHFPNFFAGWKGFERTIRGFSG